MPPVNRKRPSPTRRRPAVAGIRTPSADRGAPESVVAGSAQPTGPGEQRATSAVALAKRPRLAMPATAPSGPATGSGSPGAGLRRWRLLPVSLALAAVLLIAAIVLAGVSLVHANQQAQPDDRANVALIDAPATQQVGAATIDILQKAYSYTYTTIDADLDGAVAGMTPEMGAKHRANFATIRKTVTDAKTTTKATVVADGVRLLSGDRAEVLAFVVVTGDNGGTALQPSGYRFTASLLKVNGKWLLSDLTES